MKKSLFFCMLCFLCMQIASASEKTEIKDGEISGKVLDASLNQPLPYVNIIIKNTAGETITGGITLDDGSFKIEKIPEGKYTVNIQYIGFKSEIRNISIDRKSFKIDLGINKLPRGKPTRY